MQKLRYLAYDFQMEDLAKLIFEKKGRLLEPAFEHGRILLKEAGTNKGHLKRTELYLTQRPADEEREARQINLRGFDESMLRIALGDMAINRRIGGKAAKFNINVNAYEQSKGYGTVLMNAGAKYSEDVGVEELYGTLLLDNETDIKRRIKFYKEQLGMEVWRGENQVLSGVTNPDLNKIKFTTNKDAEEIWNSYV